MNIEITHLGYLDIFMFLTASTAASIYHEQVH
jgi:hypothetical protein